MVLMNATDIPSVVSEVLSPAAANRIASLVGIVKAVGIVFIAYLIFLIVRGLLRMRDSRRLKIIDKNVSEINHKLGLLVGEKQLDRLEKKIDKPAKKSKKKKNKK